MSGLEVVGAISACITLVDFSKKLLDAAGDANGLPEAFRVVQNLLPLIARTLQNAKDRSKAASEDDLIAVESALGSCRRDAQGLKDTLEKVMTSEKDGHLIRYKKHMRSVGKGHKVETLARQILEQLQLLQANHVFANVATKHDLQAAVTQLEETAASLDEEDGTYISNGSGPINVARDHAKQTNNNFSGEFKPQGDMNFSTVTYNHYRSKQEDEEARKHSTSQQLLASLLFDEIAWREDQIQDVHPETFRWVFNDGITPFKKWLSSSIADPDVFWVGGKAGSGKSTLMKFLADHAKTNEILRMWAGTHQLILIKHFFWNSGTSMQQSQLGLMQNLLYQILQQCPKLAPFASPERWDAISSNTTVKGWNRKEITLAIRNIMKQNSLEVNFCFFVDGLDEYTDKDIGDHCRLIQDLDTLAQSAQVKLCVSSRPWTVFKDRYNTPQTPRIIIQNHTRLDIYNYAKETLVNDERFRRLANIEPQVYDLISQIRDRADGVFLWVFLVVKSLLRGLTERDDTTELQRRLDGMDPDLYTYFRNMFDNIEPVYRPQAMRALQFLPVEGGMPLMFIHFISKEVFDSRYGLGAKIRTMTKAELDKALDKARSCVNKWCRDLVEITSYPFANVDDRMFVSVSHRTVRDFLLTQEMQKEFLKYPICQASHLKGLCMAYLALTKISSTDAIIHIRVNLFLCAKACEDVESMTPFEILDDLEMTRRTAAKQQNDSAGSRKLESRLVLRLAALKGLTLYVAKCLDRDPSCRFDIWGVILLKEIRGGTRPRVMSPYRLSMTELLLVSGFDPNDIPDNVTWDDSVRNITAWQQFLRRSSGKVLPELARLFLLNGADPDVKTMDSDGCLYDVRQYLIASDWYQQHRDKPACDREIDSWLEAARARKAAKSLEALEDIREQRGRKRLRR